MKLLATVLAGFGLMSTLFIDITVGHPFTPDTTIPSELNDLPLHRPLLPRAEPKDFYLRIMPLGASITAGEYSQGKDKNGYRKWTRDKLRADGWKVNMVGRFHTGTMADNDHEGVSGERVDEVANRVKDDKGCGYWLPNVVLINAGTNDANQNHQVSTTGQRMQDMINSINRLSPNVVIVLSTLLPRVGNEGDNNRVRDINKQYRQVYRNFVPLRDDGSEETNPKVKVVLAELENVVQPKDIHDNIHPTIYGEKQMAAAWVWAINKANGRGWIKAPAKASFSDDAPSSTCRKEYGSGGQDSRSGRQVLYAGSDLIKNDGTYTHASTPRPDRAGDIPNVNENGTVWFAQLVNRGGAYKLGEIDEMIIAHSDSGLSDNSPRKFTMYVNHGEATFPESHTITIPDSCSNEAIRWGDLNGDGNDDFICIYKNGEMYASINQGGNPPTFKNVGLYKTPEFGKGRDRVRLGDIDGDGRLDYCVMPDTGNVHCWRNGGLGDKAAYWQDLGQGSATFLAQGKGDMRGVQFVDINNDGRYDWLWMDTNGRVSTFINQRGSGQGSMKPSWLEAANNGITHGGMGEDIGGNREHVRFGRLWDGRPSYIHWKIKNNRLTFNVWKNEGSGGKYQKGDGIFWGDVTGSGFDDYVWIRSNGEVVIFRNVYDKSTPASSLYASNNNAWSTPTTLNTGFDRRALHVADWDGDGKADIIGVNREHGGVHVWLSRWDGKSFRWEYHDYTATTKGWCNQGWGLLAGDRGAHFADVTNSGRADYLCMKPDGTTTAWLRGFDGNNQPKWENVGQVKFSENLDRANFHFTDIDGDGHADLVHVDKFTGDASVWYFKRLRDDPKNNGGSAIEWEGKKKLFKGADRGPNTCFPALSGQGRGDMVWINPTTGHAWISFNTCSSNGSGDDGTGTPSDPGLPDYCRSPASPCEGSGGGGGGGGGGEDEGGDDDEDPSHEPYDPDSKDDKPLEPCYATPTSLEQMANLDFANELPRHCVPKYLVPIFLDMVEKAQKRYEDILEDGYEGYFNTYAKYIVSNANSVMFKFMKDKGDDYFNCKIWQEYPCCTTCEYLNLPCEGCIKNCKVEGTNEDGVRWDYRDQPCPPDYSGRGRGDDWEQSIGWSFKNDDAEDKFWADAMTEVGAPREEMEVIDHRSIPNWHMSYPCAQDLAANGWDDMKEICKYTGWWFNVPSTKDSFGPDDVFNPKEMISKQLETVDELRGPLAEVGLDILSDQYDGDAYDLVDALSLPVLMLEQSLSLMESVVELAKDIKEVEKTTLIVNLLSAILFMFSLGGSSLASAGMMALGRSLVVLSEAGNLGLGIYTVVGDKDAWPLLLLGLVMGGKNIKDVAKINRAANIRRDKKFDDFAVFSKDVARTMDDLAAWNKKPAFVQRCRYA